MFLYCPKCQNLISKSTEDQAEGTTIKVHCDRCYSLVDFYIKYKPVGKITGMSFDRKQQPVVK